MLKLNVANEDKNSELDQFQPDHYKKAIRFLHQVKSLEENYPDLKIESEDFLREMMDINTEYEPSNEDVKQASETVTNFSDQLSATQSVINISVEGWESSLMINFLNQVEYLAREHTGTPRDRYLLEPTTLKDVVDELEQDEDPNQPVIGRGGMFVDFLGDPEDDL